MLHAFTEQIEQSSFLKTLLLPYKKIGLQK